MIASHASRGKTLEMTLASLLSEDRVIAEMTATEQWPAIIELVDQLVSTNAVPEDNRDTVLQALKSREEDRSTGIGNGVAIPHCFSEEIEEVALVFGRSTEGIDFFAVDRALVHFIVLFVVPKSQYALHLKTLAAIAKILNSADTRESLSKAENTGELLSILSQKSSEL